MSHLFNKLSKVYISSVNYNGVKNIVYYIKLLLNSAGNRSEIGIEWLRFVGNEYTRILAKPFNYIYILGYKWKQ